MADMGSKDTQSITREVVAGLKGETVFNGEMSRLSPGITFKDALPDAVKQEMNLATPKMGPMVDTWVQRRPNSSMK